MIRMKNTGIDAINPSCKFALFLFGIDDSVDKFIGGVVVELNVGEIVDSLVKIILLLKNGS